VKPLGRREKREEREWGLHLLGVERKK